MNQTDKSKEKLPAFFKTALRKLKGGAIKAVSFLNRHKVLTCIAAFLLITASAVVGVGNHYLNKINYDDGCMDTQHNSGGRNTARNRSGDA